MMTAVARPQLASPSPQRNRRHKPAAAFKQRERPPQLRVLAGAPTREPQPRNQPSKLRLQAPAPRDLHAGPSLSRPALGKHRRNTKLAKKCSARETLAVATRRVASGVASQARSLGQGLGHCSRKTAIVGGLLGGALLAVLGVMGAASYLEQSDLLTARNLKFQSTEHLSLAQMRGLLAPAAGKPLWEIDVHALETSVLEQPWVADARVVRMYPDTLRVEVQEHAPVARTRRDDQTWLVDASGEVFAVASPEEDEYQDSLPMILGLDESTEEREHRLQVALDTIERFANGHRPKVASVWVGGAGEIAVDLRDFPTRLHFTQRELEPGLARFDALFSAAQERFTQPDAAGEEHARPWSAVFFNGADRNRVVVRYAQNDSAAPGSYGQKAHRAASQP